MGRRNRTVFALATWGAALAALALHGSPAWGDAATPPKDSPPKGAPAVATWPPEAPAFRLNLTNILGGSYNSEGVEDQVRFGAQMLLYRSKNPAFRDNFVFVGVNPRINPTATRLGPSIEIQPASFFNLKMNLELVNYFGSFSAVQSFRSALDDFSADVREQNKEAHRNYGTTGARVSITPFLQFKVGPIALRNRFTFEYFSIDLRPGEPVFYEPAYDTMLAGKGKMISDDLDLFYIIDMPAGGFFSHGRIAAGARYTAFKPLYDSTDFRPGEDRSREHNEVHRVGPLVAFSLFDDGYSRFHEPTLVAIAQWYAAHPNRTGRDMGQGVPYLVLAFIFQSDIWTDN